MLKSAWVVVYVWVRERERERDRETERDMLMSAPSSVQTCVWVWQDDLPVCQTLCLCSYQGVCVFVCVHVCVCVCLSWQGGSPSLGWGRWPLWIAAYWTGWQLFWHSFMPRWHKITANILRKYFLSSQFGDLLHFAGIDFTQKVPQISDSVRTPLYAQLPGRGI